uniref:PiggyBac transposable element n=1 Tax=Penaeus semisulcatus majanivirus TaxID=2984274 RepID=A0A9C7F6K8_9VIRU|nr:MAG: piggyBac transposable element [Penaeus semisulcatus majanivirus]
MTNDDFDLFCSEDNSTPNYHEREPFDLHSDEDMLTLNLFPDFPERESQDTTMVNNHTTHAPTGNVLTFPHPDNHDHERRQEAAGIIYDHHSDPVFPEDIKKEPPAHEPPDRHGNESRETPLVPEPADRHGNESRETPPAHESPDSHGNESQGSPPAHEPYMYFSQFFTDDIIDHIVYQVNVRLNHIIISAEEFKVFVGALIRMSLYPRYRVDQYWSKIKTYRVKEVADCIDMYSFFRIKVALPFNDRYDNSRQDEILYIYREIIEAFLTVPATPSNSVFEIPDKWKRSRRSGLFCRSSTDGFIHDVFVRQVNRTFENHHTQLDEKERHMAYQDKIVTLLIKTLENPKNSTVYSHRIKTSQKLVYTLMCKYGCRYTPFQTVSRSSAHYIDGILKYKTDLHKRTCLMDLFGYAIDLCIHNAWILYKRDCVHLDVEPISLERFRIKISDAYLFKKVKLSSVRRYNHGTSKMEICRPKFIEQHLPQRIATELKCAYCCARESHWMCEDCSVPFCLSEERNCFTEFHKYLIPSTCM